MAGDGGMHIPTGAGGGDTLFGVLVRLHLWALARCVRGGDRWRECVARAPRLAASLGAIAAAAALDARPTGAPASVAAAARAPVAPASLFARASALRASRGSRTHSLADDIDTQLAPTADALPSPVGDATVCSPLRAWGAALLNTSRGELRRLLADDGHVTRAAELRPLVEALVAAVRGALRAAPGLLVASADSCGDDLFASTAALIDDAGDRYGLSVRLSPMPVFETRPVSASADRSPAGAAVAPAGDGGTHNRMEAPTSALAAAVAVVLQASDTAVSAGLASYSPLSDTTPHAGLDILASSVPVVALDVLASSVPVVALDVLASSVPVVALDLEAAGKKAEASMPLRVAATTGGVGLSRRLRGTLCGVARGVVPVVVVP